MLALKLHVHCMLLASCPVVDTCLVNAKSPFHIFARVNLNRSRNSKSDASSQLSECITSAMLSILGERERPHWLSLACMYTCSSDIKRCDCYLMWISVSLRNAVNQTLATFKGKDADGQWRNWSHWWQGTQVA